MEEEKEQKVEQTEQPQETQNALVEDNSKAVNQEPTEPNAENKKEEENMIEHGYAINEKVIMYIPKLRIILQKNLH